jgi:erythromycin esterase-like protein
MRWSEPRLDNQSPLVLEAARVAVPFTEISQLRDLIERLGQRRIVMLGEASHGTHEFYEWRHHISRALVEEYGFNFIAVEGDWPACQQVNRYIQGESQSDSRASFSKFRRWPTWMWANSDILNLVQWLRKCNDLRSTQTRVGFYGLDIYSLFESMDEVVSTLERLDTSLAQQVKERYECFEPFQRNEKAYARSLLDFPEGCEVHVLENLKALLQVRLKGMRKEALFDVRQNARIAANAENYYRTVVQGNEDSWNVRDRHMLETLKILLEHHGPRSKGIVWAHNTHVGDHRATDMVARGQINIGGLARELWGERQVALVGFGTYVGEVIASYAWGAPMQRFVVPPGRLGSYEDAFHRTADRLETSQLCLNFMEELNNAHVFREVRGHRAIGVVYNPDCESFGNYVPTSLSHRYDAFLFFDRTRALRPLLQDVNRNEMPDTWPQGV